MNFNSIYHLFGRHPIVAEQAEFLGWLKENGASTWYDTGYSETSPQIVITSHDGASLWAFLESPPSFDDETGEMVDPPSLEQEAVFDLQRVPPREAAVRAALMAEGADMKSLAGVRPAVSFEGEAPEVTWEIDIQRNDKIACYSMDKESKPIKRAERLIQVSEKPQLLRIMADDLSSNELHTLWAFRAQAEEWTQGPLSIREKARRIMNQVFQRYSYDDGIPLISEFTWRDNLVRDRNNYRGICDEWAVVQISYLRSIGIPARLKLLIWKDSAGQGVGHACVEFRDGSSWVHMDSLWSAFDYPQRYRDSGALDVTVMDADYPLDSRSDQPAWGKPDVRGDGLLYPYGDFIINPSYPGNRRPGYSY